MTALRADLLDPLGRHWYDRETQFVLAGTAIPHPCAMANEPTPKLLGTNIAKTAAAATQSVRKVRMASLLGRNTGPCARFRPHFTRISFYVKKCEKCA